MERAERLKAILELIESQMQSYRIFRTKLASSDDPADKELLEQIARLLDRFTFEIRTEIRRTGEMDLDGSRSQEIDKDSELLALQTTIDRYEDALSSTGKAHTRAMLNRQHLELQQAYEQLLARHRAA